MPTKGMCCSKPAVLFVIHHIQVTHALTLALVGGGGSDGPPPHGFSQITRVKRGGSPRNLQYPRVDQFDT